MQANIEIISFLNSLNEALIEKMVSFDFPFPIDNPDRLEVEQPARDRQIDKELLINYIDYVSGEAGQN